MSIPLDKLQCQVYGSANFCGKHRGKVPWVGEESAPESPRKLRSCSSLEASLMKGLCEMRFWGDTTVSSSILPTPKSLGSLSSPCFWRKASSSSSSCSSSQALLSLVLQDRLSRFPGSPQTCYVAVHDLEIQSCQYSPAFDFFK